MTKESAVTKATRARRLTMGLEKHFAPGDTVVFGGKIRTRDEVIALFASHVAAIDKTTACYGAYQAAVAAERAIAKKTSAAWVDLYVFLSNQVGTSAVTDFGMKPHEKPGPKTVEAKLAGVQKRTKKKGSG